MGLLVFGLFGLYPKFSAFRLGCAIVSGYYILTMPFPAQFAISRSLWLPLFLVMFGLGLLADSLRKSGKGRLHISAPNMVNSFDIDGETFHCATAFGEDNQYIHMSRLSGGAAEISFGQLTLDLSGCEEIAPNCPINLECAFGELKLLIPQGCRAECRVDKAFANMDVKGAPSPSAHTVLLLNCHVSFGQIVLQYL